MAAPAPRDTADIRDAVASAAASGRKFEITGGGSKLRVGHSDRQAETLSMTGFTRVIDYDPAELVLTVEPGVPLADLETLLAGHNQMLAFEPYDFADVVGAEPGSTIGGVVGAGLAGSRRISAGGVRDHLLGFAAINGRGEAFKGGGKVVKNVTGYDLPKLMAGSWGRLAVLTELTLKVLPRPPVARTLALRGLSNETALDSMTRAMSSQAEVAAASHLPPRDTRAALTTIRIEGFGPSVEAREAMLRRILGEAGRIDVLDADEASAHWTGIRSGAALAVSNGPVLWRIVVPPSHGARLVSGIAALNGAALLDWAGGLCWARTPVETSTDAVRRLAESAGGHATLADAPDGVRGTTPALHPEPAALAALSKRVRAAFDPAGVFETGRFAPS
jgi:glycolate oxidase FAD binding subunit